MAAKSTISCCHGIHKIQVPAHKGSSTLRRSKSKMYWEIRPFISKQCGPLPGMRVSKNDAKSIVLFHFYVVLDTFWAIKDNFFYWSLMLKFSRKKWSYWTTIGINMFSSFPTTKMQSIAMIADIVHCTFIMLEGFIHWLVFQLRASKLDVQERFK